MRKFSISRAGSHYQPSMNRSDFLTEESEAGGTAQLCNVLAKCVHDFFPASAISAATINVSSSAAGDAPRSPVAALGYTPWFTPVVGSGCLESLPQQHVIPEHLAAAVAERLAGMEAPEVPAGSESWATIGRRFTQSLAEERTRHASGGVSTIAEHLTVSDEGARLVLVTALLTRYLHATRAVAPRALSRRNDERVSRDPSWTQLDDIYDLKTTVVEPLKMLLESARDDIGKLVRDGALANQIGFICDDIRSGLDKGRGVSESAVRLLTETTWYIVTKPLGTYFGWTEVLVWLILRDAVKSSRRRRPAPPNLQSPIGWIRELYKLPSTRRVEKVLDGTIHDDPPSIYRAIAQSLIAECHVFDRVTASAPEAIPHPLAISLAFDLELEMQLLAQGQPFTIALPIHLATSDTAPVDTFWVAGDVDPGKDVWTGEAPDDAPFLLRPHNWRLLSRAVFATSGAVRPIVIRMVGGPLVDLSLLRPNEIVPGSNEEFRFGPLAAVTIDEYHAMRMGELEMLNAAYKNVEQSTGSPEMRYGLPPNLFQDKGKTSNPLVRAWAMFGVPLTDPALRQRFMSLQAVRHSRAWGYGSPVSSPHTARTALGSARTAPVESDEDGEIAAPGDLLGFAVNKEVDYDQAFFLSWLGFKVVQAPVEDFVDDIVHYSRHLAVFADADDSELPERAGFDRVRCLIR